MAVHSHGYSSLFCLLRILVHMVFVYLGLLICFCFAVCHFPLGAQFGVHRSCWLRLFVPVPCCFLLCVSTTRCHPKNAFQQGFRLSGQRRSASLALRALLPVAFMQAAPIRSCWYSFQLGVRHACNTMVDNAAFGMQSPRRIKFPI